MADEPNKVFFVEPTEDDEICKLALQELLSTTMHLGPIIHTCILAQAIGIIAGSTPENLMTHAGFKETMNMNFDVGLASVPLTLMEKSLEQGKPN